MSLVPISLRPIDTIPSWAQYSARRLSRAIPPEHRVHWCTIERDKGSKMFLRYHSEPIAGHEFRIRVHRSHGTGSLKVYLRAELIVNTNDRHLGHGYPLIVPRDSANRILRVVAQDEAGGWAELALPIGEGNPIPVSVSCRLD